MATTAHSFDTREHADLQALLGVFAVNAIDDDERCRVEDHLRTCRPCRDEAADHLEVVGLLSLLDGSALGT